MTATLFVGDYSGPALKFENAVPLVSLRGFTELDCIIVLWRVLSTMETKPSQQKSYIELSFQPSLTFKSFGGERGVGPSSRSRIKSYIGCTHSLKEET